MIRGIATGLAGLGLIGGAGAVAYDDEGTPTVTIEDKQTGAKQTVKIDAGSGAGYTCPASVQSRFEKHDITLGRIKLTIRPVERKLDKIDQQYPGSTAPASVAERYNRLLRRNKRLTRAYNAEVDARNATLTRECQRESE